MSNKLDEIIAKEYGCKNITEVLRDFGVSPAMIKQCMIAAMKMVLEEAAENGEIKDTGFIGEDGWEAYQEIDKKSITDTLNKYL